MTTNKKSAANRANAQKSTGPRTPAGKAAVAQNARRHGLSGPFSILAHEDRDEFQKLLDGYRAEFKPVSLHESFLVEEMAQARWTLARARRIEAHLLDQLAGAPPTAGDPDAAIAADLNAKSATALVTVQRYISEANKAYYRANRTLTQARSADSRNKANEAQVWLKAQLQQMPSIDPEPPFPPAASYPLPSEFFSGRRSPVPNVACPSDSVDG